MKRLSYLLMIAATLVMASCNPDDPNEPKKYVYTSYDPVTVGIDQYGALIGKYAINETQVVQFAKANSYAENYREFLPNQFEYYGDLNGGADMVKWPVIETNHNILTDEFYIAHDISRDSLYAGDTTHVVLDVWYTDTLIEIYDTIVTKIERKINDEYVNKRTGETITADKDTSYMDTSYVKHTFDKVQHVKCIGWRAPSVEEMDYILAHHSHSIATVCERHGLMILPQGYEAANFTPEATDWATNTYDYNQWTELQGKGVVFLPAAGLGDDIAGINKKETELGVYWLGSTDAEGVSTYHLDFTNEYYSTMHSCKNAHNHNLRMILLPEYELTYILAKGSYDPSRI